MGDSKTPLAFLTLSSFLNIALDLICIINLNMGVAGAAVATVVSQAVSGVLCLIYMIKKFPLLRVENGEWKGEKVITVIAPEEIEELCRVMIPRSGAYYNSLFKADSTDIEVQRDSEDEKNFVGACFPKGSVPEFVESEFEKTTPSD